MTPFLRRVLHFGVIVAKPGAFLYADACPHCHQQLAHNTVRLSSAPVNVSHQAKAWPIRLFLAAVRLVES